jgi:hypothetical protein
MNVALRHGLHGLGQSGETETEGGGLPGGSIDFSSGEVASPFVYTTPWTDETIGVTSATPEEQAAARTWIAHAFDPLNVNKIAQALRAGTIIASRVTPAGAKVCSSGYAYPNGQCIQTTGTSQQLIPGVSNQTLAIVGFAFVVAMVMFRGGGRR